jgi:hypothetical protein
MALHIERKLKTEEQDEIEKELERRRRQNEQIEKEGGRGETTADKAESSSQHEKEVIAQADRDASETSRMTIWPVHNLTFEQLFL